MKNLIILLPLVLLVSCGKQKKIIPPAMPEMYEYGFNTKECSTGQHNFFTLDEACDALKKDSLNNNCASEEREKLYKSSCSGDFII